MIIKSKNIATNISPDSIFKIIEIYFTGLYKTTKLSDSKLHIKKLYRFKSNGWETIQKQLNFEDTGYFKIRGSHIILKMDLTKPIVFWALMAVCGTFILWGLFNVSPIVTYILIAVSVMIGWILGIYKLRQFINSELNAISTRLNDK